MFRVPMEDFPYFYTKVVRMVSSLFVDIPDYYDVVRYHDTRVLDVMYGLFLMQNEWPLFPECRCRAEIGLLSSDHERIVSWQRKELQMSIKLSENTRGPRATGRSPE